MRSLTKPSAKCFARYITFNNTSGCDMINMVFVLALVTLDIHGHGDTSSN